jgi:hypothetical protein
MGILDYFSGRSGVRGRRDVARFYVVQAINLGLGVLIWWFMTRENLGWGVLILVPLAAVGIFIEFITLTLWGILDVSGQHISMGEWAAGILLSLSGPVAGGVGVVWGWMHACGS